MTKITLLGTSCMVPTKERNTSGIAIEHEGECILFDCGEGTQRQMNIAGINRNSVTRIFISHWHADHIAGLLGLIQTIDAEDKELHIYGPVESKQRLDSLLASSYHEQKLHIAVHEVTEDSQICETDVYLVDAKKLDHTVPCIGFRFKIKDRRRINTTKIKELGIPEGPILAKFQAGETVEWNGQQIIADDVTYIAEGKVFSYIADTAFTKNAVELAQDADVVVCEATYASDKEENAEMYKHMTSQQAAQIASMANAKRLLLTHISQRYKTTEELVDQAKDIFPETEVGYDFLSIKL